MKDTEIKLVLENAFSKEIQKAPRLSHSDCLLYRSKLISLRTSDIKQFLPQVLMDLVDTHTDDMNNPENAGLIVDFLLPADICSPPKGEAQQSKRSMSEGQKFLAKCQHEIFDSFNSKQSAAIAKWLQFAANWDDLFFSRDQIEEAIRYWKKEQ